MQKINISSVDPDERLDSWLARTRTECSRARWQELIKTGQVLVNGVSRKANYRLSGDEILEFQIPEPETTELIPEDIPLNILYEDSDLLVLNKTPDMVVHPAPGHAHGTLVNALLHHCTDLQGIGGELRPGIVHRLDKDTSGALVVAKNENALTALADQFKAHTVRKEYLALVWGQLERRQGTLKTLIGRSPHDRKKMSAVAARGREAVTHYTTVEIFRQTALLRVRIETGRTHQIRVHMAHLHHPIVGDQQYGRDRAALPGPAIRQMLHAEKIAFVHPRTGKPLEFLAPMPDDMCQLIELLRREVSP